MSSSAKIRIKRRIIGIVVVVVVVVVVAVVVAGNIIPTVLHVSHHC